MFLSAHIEYKANSVGLSCTFVIWYGFVGSHGEIDRLFRWFGLVWFGLGWVGLV